MNRIGEIRLEEAFYEAQINEIYPASADVLEDIEKVEEDTILEKDRPDKSCEKDKRNYREDSLDNFKERIYP